MADFTDEHKKDLSNTFFEEGVHKVKITKIERGETDNGKEFMEFSVKGEGDKEDSTRVWFTTDAAIGFSFSIIRGIFVHNAPADKKDEIRASVDALKNTTDLEKACKVLIGKEAWFTVYQDPSRTYINDKGETKNSYNKNIYGYEPSPRKMTPETTTPDNTEPIKHTDENGEEQLISDF